MWILFLVGNETGDDLLSGVDWGRLWNSGTRPEKRRAGQFLARMLLLIWGQPGLG